MRAALLALLVAAEVAAAPRVLNRLGPYPRLDRRDRLGGVASPYYESILADSYSLPGGECSGQALTTGTGSSVTWVRSSAAWCNKADGTYVSVSSNQPRLSSVAGKPSVLIEGVRTNSALRSRELSNAAWTASNMTCAKTATGIDGVSNSATSCLASASNGSVTQSGTYGSSANRAVSVFVKRGAGSGNIELTADGSTWAVLSASNCRKTSDFSTSAPSSSFWVRCQVTASLNNWTVGVRLATLGDSVSLDFAQIENGTTASSPIETVATAASRSGEFGYFPTPTKFSNLLGCLRASFMPTWTASPPAVAVRFLVRGDLSLYWLGYAQAGDNWSAYDAISTPGIAAAYTAFTRKSYATRWDDAANLLRVENLTANTGTQTVFNTWGAGTSVYIGEHSQNIYNPFGYMNNISFSDTYAGCVL